ncbi:30S ribosomal protein S8 [Candidatus Peregrinibacteria bacterium]|jgi:small subunit ribosomal protein S8|nr:30S ribosomal protein S8 [Candidatus Peregrinibacteria bacterium]MBT4055680.1 30S ribosomal protein S8 [Candidatus Peregrinibacteria bacterium]
MNTDPIADLLTRIRNASNARLNSTNCPHSKLKENLLKLIQKFDFIEKYEVTKDKFPELVITLKEDRKLTLKRVSKPGQRIYLGKDKMKPLKSGLGISIVSTSKGLMTSIDAAKQGLGGEVLCEII